MRRLAVTRRAERRKRATRLSRGPPGLSWGPPGVRRLSAAAPRRRLSAAAGGPRLRLYYISQMSGRERDDYTLTLHPYFNLEGMPGMSPGGMPGMPPGWPPAPGASPGGPQPGWPPGAALPTLDPAMLAALGLALPPPGHGATAPGATMGAPRGGGGSERHR